MSYWPHQTFYAVPPPYVAENLAADVRRAVFGGDGAGASRCDLKMVCSVGGFSVREIRISNVQDRHEALLVPKMDGCFEIAVDPSLGSDVRGRTRIHRIRFRVAHEIAHSFFYDRERRPARRIVNGSEAEEAFCDNFASALLVPRSVVRAMLPEPESIFRLRDVFDVSAEVAGRALAQAHGDASIVCMRYYTNPATRQEPAWRVSWSAGPRFIPAHARLHSEIVKQAAEVGKAKGVEGLGVGNARGQFLVTALMSFNRSQIFVILLPA